MAEIVAAKIKGNRLGQVVLAFKGQTSDFQPSAIRTIAEFAKLRMNRANAEQIISGGERGAKSGVSPQWPPLSKKYARWKQFRYPGRPILVRDQTLFRDAINGSVVDLQMGGGRSGFKLQWNAPVGTTKKGGRDPYGILHQFGIISGITSQRKLRPWVVMTGADAAAITNFTSDVLVGQIKQQLLIALGK